MLRNKSVMLILHPIFPASKKIISTKLTCGFKSLKTGTSFTHTLSLNTQDTCLQTQKFTRFL